MSIFYDIFVRKKVSLKLSKKIWQSLIYYYLLSAYLKSLVWYLLYSTRMKTNIKREEIKFSLTFYSWMKERWWRVPADFFTFNVFVIVMCSTGDSSACFTAFTLLYLFVSLHIQHFLLREKMNIDKNVLVKNTSAIKHVHDLYVWF